MASVLVVDDAAFMRLTIRQMLEAHGHSVAAEAANGVEAVRKYKEAKPDVVLLDITMPEMDGLAKLKYLKELDSNARIIICTALGHQEKVAQAIENGASDFIVKPFKEERLMSALDKVLSM